MRSKCGLGWVRSRPLDGWIPSAIGPHLWLRADLGITIATGVSSWADQSGGARHAVQVVAVDQPAFVPNVASGLPGVKFSRTASINMKLISTASYPVGTSKFCMYAVTYMTAADYAAQGTSFAHSFGTDASPYLVMTPCNRGSSDPYPLVASGSSYHSSSVGTVLGAFCLQRFGWVAGSMTHRVENTSTAIGPWTPADAAVVSVGNRYSSGLTFCGTICELVVVCRDVSGDDNARMLSYLANRYSRPWVP